MESSIDKIKAILESNSLRITHQRIEILKELMGTKSHPTAEEIYSRLSKNFPALSFATVYKTLDTLVKNNIVRKIKTEDQAVHYDADMSNHHHIVCVKSNKIDDYMDAELNEMINRYFENKSIPNFRITDIQLNIIGEKV